MTRIWTPPALAVPNRHARRARESRLKKRSVSILEAIRTKPHGDYWPMCCICQRAVDAQELVEVKDRMAQVVVKCHGDEQLMTFELETGWTDHELASRMQRFRWFEPTL